jgi:ATP-dependent DNA helicase PIF1
MSFNELQLRAIDLAQQGQNVFLSGEAGTGKSFTTAKVISRAYKRFKKASSVCVTASTGVAAVAIGGTTLHSWAGLGLAEGPKEALLIEASARPYAWKYTQFLVIDEFPMISCELFEKLEWIARKIRKDERPFGGIQLFLVGDFAQLPPVVPEGSLRVHAFEADCWVSCMGTYVELSEVFRQKDMEFVGVLRHARMGRMPADALAVLQRQVRRDDEPLPLRNGVAPTKLYCTKASVEAENQRALRQLDGESVVFESSDKSDGTAAGIKQLKFLQKNLTTPATLELKVGAQVMITANMNVLLEGEDASDPKAERCSVVNGTRGVVDGMEDDHVIVKLISGTLVRVDPYKWKREVASIVQPPKKCKKAKEVPPVVVREVLASRTQIPLILAWAVTVHKAQGATLDYMLADLRGVFGDAQAYVALSRATALENLYLRPFGPAAFQASSKVMEFLESVREVRPLKRRRVQLE